MYFYLKSGNNYNDILLTQAYDYMWGDRLVNHHRIR